MVKHDFEYVYNYIKNRNCTLLTEEYKNNSQKLKILFSCGHIDYRSFDSFNRSSNLCKRCTNHDSLNFSEANEKFKEYGYYISDNDQYKEMTSKLTIYDDYGYKYYISLSCFLSLMNNGSKPTKFDSRNPYVIENIIFWLSINLPSLKLRDREKYLDKKKKMTFYDNDGYYYYLTFDGVQDSRNNSFSFVANNNKYSIDNISLWLKKNNKDFYLLDGQSYRGNLSKLYFKCKKCDPCENPFQSNWANIISGRGCPYCSSRKVGKCNNFGYLFSSSQVINEWDYDKNYPITPFDVLPYSNKKYFWICNECKNSYSASLNSRNGLQKSGCPRCSKSKGEKKIEEFFVKNNISFIDQFSFSDCKDKGILKFDFAIYDNIKLIFLLEYDGELHFQENRRRNKRDSSKLENCKKRDIIKDKYCKKNNIDLLRIPYWEFDHIEKILEEKLLELNLLQGEEV